MRRNTLPLTILLFTLFALPGCAQMQPLPAAQAMAEPTRTLPAAIPFTPKATATAVVFQLKPSSTPLPSPTPIPALSSYAYGPVDFPRDVNPLTGRVVDDPSRLERRPLAIKVTNFPPSVRPQWGLSLADHVYEYYIGDAMTRFIAIFYGQDASRVGPIRSARFFDEHIQRMYKAFLTFAGADPRVMDPWMESDMRRFLVIERPSNCPPLCRIGPEDGYNTLYADTLQLSEYVSDFSIGNSRQDLHGLAFAKYPPAGELAAGPVAIHFSHVSYHLWEYEPGSRRYLRFQEAQVASNGEKSYLALSDSLTGEQIAADNLVVLLIPHEYFVNTTTTEMVKMGFTGQGQGYAFREGMVYPLNWRRVTPEALLSLHLPNGSDFPLKAGNTWFEVLGESSTVESDSGGWNFSFKIP